MNISDRTLQLAKETRESLAGSSLTPSVAKLYSQHTRLLSSRPGLSSWGRNESVMRLDDANRLIHCALVEREAGEPQWIESMRRAGELLEWLSHSEFHLEDLPIQLLAAAAYQLAGYPARSLGLLKDSLHDEPVSAILMSMLSGDFLKLTEGVVEFWEDVGFCQNKVGINTEGESEFSERVSQWITAETIRALGILCAYMRWGEEDRLPAALSKLDAVSKVYLHGYDSYGWLLMKLCSEIAAVYYDCSLRNSIKSLKKSTSQDGQRVFERYIRYNYSWRKGLAWPSQIRGIQKLDSNLSFALCTPTGSGKTTIAEMAIIQSLFVDEENELQDVMSEGIILYLVPSRALATEVESKLSTVMNRISNTNRVIVTGLYGGTDWGPTDAWLTADDKTVLICTYEKAEALIRFMGPLFLHRVALVVLDEAHSIMFDGRDVSLRNSNSRSLKLESLCSRLFFHIPENSRIIALSAVAAGIEDSLASWVMNEPDSTSIKNDYKSTRQLVGRLECLPNRRFQIRYDIMDGASLEFKDGDANDVPFVPEPFPPCPPAQAWEVEGPDKHLRPHLFWAAMNLAAPDNKGEQHSVLISITQKIDNYAKDFLALIDLWEEDSIPNFFKEPIEAWKSELWKNSLRSCADYFGEESKEYRLLSKGIVLHHGKMPGIMSRLLVELIQKRVVHVVVATSTLSEGVNLPFETILIPSLRRWGVEENKEIFISQQEFKNLIGRAGRPGSGTEGRSLISLSNQPGWGVDQARKRYSSLIREIQKENINSANSINAKSPLARLLRLLAHEWSRITGSKSKHEFLNWLECTAPIGYELLDGNEDHIELIQYLDTLDFNLLSCVQEIEELQGELNNDELEQNLIRIWQRSFARYVSKPEEVLNEIFVHRGMALKKTVYPDGTLRKRLYGSGLPPREGKQLLDLYPELKELLITGSDFALWDNETKIDYIAQIVELLSTIPRFNLDKEPGGGKNKPSWSEILCWWLTPNQCIKRPSADKVAGWYNYVSRNFIYKFSWGIGNTIALAICEADEEVAGGLSIQEWPKLGLPWVVFWLKEIIQWGTLDPVATCLLSHGIVVTREEAEGLAEKYYEEVNSDEGNEIFNASTIKNWVELNFNKPEQKTTLPFKQLEVNLQRDFTHNEKKFWRVLPVISDENLYWIDPAGYSLAASLIPTNWDINYINHYDFILDVESSKIRLHQYV